MFALLVSSLMLSALCHQVVKNVSQLAYGGMLGISDKSSLVKLCYRI